MRLTGEQMQTFAFVFCFANVSLYVPVIILCMTDKIQCVYIYIKSQFKNNYDLSSPS